MNADPGYSGYDDPRLQPPDEPEMQPADWMGDCTHAAACRMQWERRFGELMDGFTDDMLARDLGCGEACECWEG